MAREKLALHRNDIIRQYANGASASSVAAAFGVSTTTITRILKGAGVMPALKRGETTKRADEARVVQMFLDGTKPADIIRTTGVSKSCLYSIIQRHGAKLRGHVNEVRTVEQMQALAIGREAAGFCNENEKLFSDLLSELGLKHKPQVALGTGCIDFVLTEHSIAVEVSLRGTFNKYVDDGWFLKRIRDCAERGWHLYIFGGRDAADINADAMQDILAWAQFTNSSPASRRQYRVVWGGFDLLATGCSDDCHITIPKPSAYASQVADRKGESRRGEASV